MDDLPQNILNLSDSKHHPLAKSDEQVRRDIDQLSLEFLLNKKMYKKIIGTTSLQTERENEERKQYMIKYNAEIVKLFGQLLNNREKVKVSHEIHEIFDSFIDKSVSYFIRTQKMLNPQTRFGEDDDDDEEDHNDDDDEQSADGERPKTNKKKMAAAFNTHIYGKSGSMSSGVQQKIITASMFGDDIQLDTDS
jgi:hypothetical protein